MLLGVPNVKINHMPINSQSSLGWKKNKIKVLVRYGMTYFKYLLKLIKFVKKENIDLIYVSGKKEIAFAYLVKLLIGTRYIYHSHGFNSSKDIKKLYLLAINSAEKIIPVSNIVNKILIEAGANIKKIEVVYNGLNLNCASRLVAETPQKLLTRDDVFTVIYVGSIQPLKGIHILLKAINILIKKELNIRLFVLGESPNSNDNEYYNKLISIAHEIDSNKFVFYGFRDNIYDYIKYSDLLVLPSTEESFGMVILEAMFMKKPVIGSNIGGIPEVIDDGITGLLFRSNDEEDLANKIERLYNDMDLRIELGNNGRARLEEKLTAEIQSNKILNIIGDIATTI
jgi:glycosyltransferase involved in cell wall biosynthesis